MFFDLRMPVMDVFEFLEVVKRLDIEAKQYVVDGYLVKGDDMRLCRKLLQLKNTLF